MTVYTIDLLILAVAMHGRYAMPPTSIGESMRAHGQLLGRDLWLVRFD